MTESERIGLLKKWAACQKKAGALLVANADENERVVTRLQEETGEYVCRGCLLPWSQCHHGHCSGLVRYG